MSLYPRRRNTQVWTILSTQKSFLLPGIDPWCLVFQVRNLVTEYVEIKYQLDTTEVFIADLIACSTCFGHHYAHNQELKSIIQCVRFAGCCSILQTGHITLSSTPDQQLENHSTKYHRQQPLYNALELLMMGIVVPETCWASNKICNKNLCCI